jgi:hypothetical protein
MYGTQLLTTYDAPDFSIQGEMKMHYEPPASIGGIGSGRVVWEDDSSGDALFLLEFEVAADNSLSASNDTVLIMSTLEIGGIGDFDIGSDHDSLAFSYHWPDTKGNGYSDGESLYIVSINDCLRSTWIPSDPTTCNASGYRQEILSVPNTNTNDSGTRWTFVSWNFDRSRIYLNQSKHTEVSGIQIAEKDSSGDWHFSGVVSQATLGGVTTFPAAT